MNNKCYSVDNELFNYTEIYEAAESAFSQFAERVGDILTIYEGTPVRKKASDFYRSLLENMMACAYLEKMMAYDEFSDLAEGFLSNVSLEQEQELDDEIKEVIDKWADKYNQHPTFYGVEGIKPIQIRLTGIEPFAYKIVG